MTIIQNETEEKMGTYRYRLQITYPSRWIGETSPVWTCEVRKSRSYRTHDGKLFNNKSRYQNESMDNFALAYLVVELLRLEFPSPECLMDCVEWRAVVSKSIRRATRAAK